MMWGSVDATRRLDGALAGVEKVLEGNDLLLALDGVHLGLVVLEEELGVALEHGLELVLHDGGVEGEVADDVVEVTNVHVEELVGGGAVEDGEVLAEEQVLVELDVLELDVIEVTLKAGVEGDDGVEEVGGLLLVEEGDEAGTTDHGDGLDLLATDGVGGELAVLGEDGLELTGDGLHGDVLGGGTNTGHGETNVDGGALTTGEQLGVEVDLAVSDGDDVGDNVGGHIVGEGLNDGEGSDGTTTTAGGKHGSALQETGVEVEDVTGVGLTTGGTAEEEGELTVGNSLLGQIVVDAEAMATAVHEVLTHGDTGVGGKELETSGLGGGGGHDGGVVQGTVGLEETVDTGDVGATLANGDVDGDDGVLGQNLLVHADLVDDGGDGNGGLTGLAITNNQLTLTTTDGDHGIDGLETGQDVVVHGGAGHNVGGTSVDLTHDLGGVSEQGGGAAQHTDGDLVAEGVHDLAQDVATDGDVQQLAGGVDLLAGLDVVDVVHQDDTDATVLLQVEDQAGGRGGGVDLDLDDGVVRDSGVAGGGDHGGDGTVDAVDVTDEVSGLEEGLLGISGGSSGLSGIQAGSSGAEATTDTGGEEASGATHIY
eukprot:482109_1